MISKIRDQLLENTYSDISFENKRNLFTTDNENGIQYLILDFVNN